jgi:hypothetical protein
LRTLFGLSDEIRGFLLGFTQRIGGTLGSELLLVLATFGRSQAFSDLGLTVAIAFCSGGQTYFIVIQMKRANQIAWPISVALIFTLTSW